MKASRLLYASPFGALIAASACSLLTSVDDLTGAGANEAGADAADVKSGDAFGADATTADTGSDAAKPFCLGLSPAPLFCQDFDEDPIGPGLYADFVDTLAPPFNAPSNTSERFFDEFPDRMAFACRQHIIVGFRLLHDHPHAFDVITRMAPVTRGI